MHSRADHQLHADAEAVVPVTVESRSRAWVARFCRRAVIGLSAIMVVNFVVDPFQHYRRAAFYKPLFIGGKQRYVNPGVAKNYPYDAVIIGSSVSENFRKAHVDATLGVNVAKLSMAGMSAYEMRRQLDVVFAAGKARTVIVTLDFYAFHGEVDRLFQGRGSMPFYLYDDDPWNDFFYLMNADVAYESIESLLPFMKKKRRSYENAYLDPFVSDTGTLLRLYRKGGAQTIIPEKFDPGAMMTSFRRNFLEPVSSRKDIRFIVIYPPYSILAWHDVRMKGNLGKLLEFKRKVMDELLALGHVEQYDFQHDGATITDLRNYKDPVHYSHHVCDRMIESVRDGRNRVDARSVPANIATLETIARGYRLPAGGN